MELRIKVKNVYGNETIYPVCDKGKLLAEWKGQKTFTERDIKILKKLGYTFKIASDYQHLMGGLVISEQEQINAI